ncbi:MAG: trypsin-like peptidase domain-containing protein [Thermodesulfobacteriota bacterium]
MHCPVSLWRQAMIVLGFLCIIALALVPGARAEQVLNPERPLPRGGCPDLVELIKQLTPIVVSISVERHMLQNSSSEPPPLFRSGRAWSEERGRGRAPSQHDGIGSGFICDADGHIVTNGHVVEGAAKILVTLASGKVVYAKSVAVHPKVDLALLKIDPPYGLHTARIGNSEGVEVGEWVLAVGNPFGLGRTVTFGIVSGKGRFLGLGNDASFDNFIQTDASINPGNSGGPLFNMVGEVIGVNTAIIAAGKGIGFAIPSNYLKELIRASPTMAKPARGWLGVYVQDQTKGEDETKEEETPEGTFVDEVLESTPAYNAGLRKGDLIIDANGKPISNGRDLSRIVARSKPGDLLRMVVRRGTKTRSVDVVVGKAPE